nr:hypothetical protein [uncultured bacterium]
MFVAPMALNIHGGISVSVNHHVDSVLLQAFGQLRDEQLSSAVIFRWNGDERGAIRAILILELLALTRGWHNPGLFVGLNF